MKHIYIFLCLFLISSGAVSEGKKFLCEGLLECPNGCLGSVKNLEVRLDGQMLVDRPFIKIEIDPFLGMEWTINKEDDERVYFSGNNSGVNMIGSVHRYTGELIAHNDSAIKGGKLNIYLKMICRPRIKLL